MCRIKIAAPVGTLSCVPPPYWKKKTKYLSDAWGSKLFYTQEIYISWVLPNSKCRFVANCWQSLCPYLDSCEWHLHQITQVLFIFEMCTDPLLSPKGRNVTFVCFSRKIFLRSSTDLEKKAVLWDLIHNSLLISSFLTVITSCLHS